MRPALAALAVAPLVSAAASWWKLSHAESGLQLVECYNSDEDSTDDPHDFCWLHLNTPRLGGLQTCNTAFYFDPAVQGQVTTQPNHCLESHGTRWQNTRVAVSGCDLFSPQNVTWTFRESGQIELSNTNLCLDLVDGDLSEYGTGLFQLWTCTDGNKNQIWRRDPVQCKRK